MRFLITLIFTLMLSYPSFSQAIRSGVFSLDDARSKETDFGSVKLIASGSTRDFDSMDITFLTIYPGKSCSLIPGGEKLLIVRSSHLTLEKSAVLSDGSVVVLDQNHSSELKNDGQENLELYLFEYKSVENNTHSETTLPLVIDWESIPFKPHDKGGIRNFFDMETSECHRFEMHVTNLNTGIKSHEPHTHRAGEFVLVKKGNTEMEIDGKIYKGNAGDLYWLESEISHAIKNIGEEQCQYFAFQME